MNWASYLLSLCLHLAVFLLIMFWPSSPPVNLETPPVMISLVDGAPGGNRTPSSILGKMGKPTDGPKDVSPPAKKADAAAPERPEVKADPTADKARPVEAKPEPKVERKPEPKHEVKPKPEPKDATPVAEKKDKKKKEDKKKDDDKKPEKPKKDDKKKDDKKSTPKDDKKTDKKADKPSKGDPVAAAMNQARREATSRVESGDKGSSVEQALAQARRNAGGDGGGGFQHAGREGQTDDVDVAGQHGRVRRLDERQSPVVVGDVEPPRKGAVEVVDVVALDARQPEICQAFEDDNGHRRRPLARNCAAT